MPLLGAPLDIMKAGNISPLAVIVAETVAHFMSIVDACTWIVFVHIIPSFFMERISNGSLVHAEDALLVSVGNPLSHQCNEVIGLIFGFLEVLLHGMHHGMMSQSKVIHEVMDNLVLCCYTFFPRIWGLFVSPLS